MNLLGPHFSICHSRFVLCFLWIVTCSCPAVFAENWPQWRGPHQNCIVPGQGYPTKWGEDEQIRWKVKLPGWGTSTPAIWGERIFVTGEEDGKNVLCCLDRDGDKKWQVSIGSSAGNRNRKASGANPSPVTDGTLVYAYYRSGDLACVDFGGDTVWQMNLQAKYGPDRLNWDLGTSPVLTKDFVVVAVMHQGPSYLLALHKQNGEVAWKHDRDLDAPTEANDSYTTPLVLDENGTETLVVLGADHVTAHRADTGAEMWRFGGLNPQARRNFRQIASATATDEMILAPYARGDTLTSIRRRGTADVSASHQAWLSDVSADVPCPIAYNGRVYICGDRGDITCIDLESGNEVWTERLPRSRHVYSSSPVIADGRLYATREDGTTFVLELGDKPKLVATNALRENTYATPVFVDGRVFLRTSDYLFCIGDK